MPNLGKNAPDVINAIVEPVIQFMSVRGYQSGCEYFGRTDEALHCYLINGNAHIICETCKGQMQENLEIHKEEQLIQKSKFVPGLIGAFLGALIGAVLWILIYKLGYIAGIAGAVTSICALKGYEMLGGHLDRKGVITSVIVMILMIFLANKIAWSLELYNELSAYDWTFSDCYQNLMYVLSEAGITGSYVQDLVVGYLLTALCCVKPIMQTFKTSGGDYSIKG